MKIVLLPEAEHELIEVADWYGRDVRVAQAFVLEVERAIGQLAAFPSSAPRLFTFRRCVLHKFPYVIIYKVLQDHLLVVAIAHASRRPGYWRRRVTKK